MWRKRLEFKEDKERIIKDVEKSRQMTFDRAVNLLTYKPRSIIRSLSSLNSKRLRHIDS
jgi:hypothetical protein